MIEIYKHNVLVAETGESCRAWQMDRIHTTIKFGSVLPDRVDFRHVSVPTGVHEARMRHLDSLAAMVGSDPVVSVAGMGTIYGTVYTYQVPWALISTPMRYRLVALICKRVITGAPHSLVEFLDSIYPKGIATMSNLPRPPGHGRERCLSGRWTAEALEKLLAYKADDPNAWTPKEWLTHAESIPYLSLFTNEEYLAHFTDNEKPVAEAVP